MIVVGDLVEELAVAAITKLFGDWPASATPAGTSRRRRCRMPARPAARQLVSVPMMNKSQADVVYGFIGVKRSDPDYIAMSVMNNALGQYAIGGKLGDSIRERQGMAYYVYSSLDATFGAGPVFHSRRRGGRQCRAHHRVDRRGARRGGQERLYRAGDRRVEELHDRRRCLASSRPMRQSRPSCSTSKRSGSASTTISGCPD